MAELAWMVSGWDGIQHAFPSINVVASEGICGHCALSSGLTVPADERRCLACVLIVERALQAEEAGAAAEEPEATPSDRRSP